MVASKILRPRAPELLRRFSRCRPPGSGLLVGVSGGPDSGALAALLAQSPACRPIHLGWVVHGFRPADEERERAALQELSHRLAVPLHEAPVAPPPAWTEGMAIPEAEARRLRYGALEELAAREGLAVVATAHHRDDRRETQLLHLTRGGGLRALVGMRERRTMGTRILWRPLLGIAREELRELVRELELPHVQDPSNLDLRLRRNRLRLRIVPGLAAAGDPLLARLDRLSGRALRALARVERTLRALTRRLERPSAHRGLRLMDARGVESLGVGLLHHWLERFAEGAAIRGPRSRDIAGWLQTGANGRQDCGAFLVERSGPWIGIRRRPATPGWIQPWRGDALEHPDGTWIMTPGEEGPQSLFHGRVPLGAHVRTRRHGDQVDLPGRGHRKLAALFVEHRVARSERDAWPVVEHRGRVLWVPGLHPGPRELQAPSRSARFRELPDPRSRFASLGPASPTVP